MIPSPAQLAALRGVADKTGHCANNIPAPTLAVLYREKWIEVASTSPDHHWTRHGSGRQRFHKKHQRTTVMVRLTEAGKALVS
jgi:hypothetical protein